MSSWNIIKDVLLENFKTSCDFWYGFMQNDTKQVNLENNYKGRQEISKRLQQEFGIPGSLDKYREIKDDLAKIEIKACVKHHDCYPPLRDLYPPSKELAKWMNDNEQILKDEAYEKS